MDTDRPFRIERFLHTYSYEAARFAVLRRFTDLRQGWQLAEGRLRAWWRDRLVELERHAVVRWLSGRSSLAFARNCPPVGVVTSNRTRHCNWSLVCPYCRARLAAAAYKRMAALAFPVRRAPASPYSTLALLRLELRLPVRGGFAGLYEPAEEVADDVWRASAKSARDCLSSSPVSLLASPPLVDAAVSYAQPVLTADDLRVRIAVTALSTRGRQQVEADVEALRPRLLPLVLRYRFADGVTRRALTRLVAAPFHFPFQMYSLFADGVLPPFRLRELADMCVGRRLLRTHGKCYDLPRS